MLKKGEKHQLQCKTCGGDVKKGGLQRGRQRYICRSCKRSFPIGPVIDERNLHVSRERARRAANERYKRDADFREKSRARMRVENLTEEEIAARRAAVRKWAGENKDKVRYGNSCRVKLGKTFFGMAKTRDQAQEINSLLRDRFFSFKKRQREGRAASTQEVP